MALPTHAKTGRALCSGLLLLSVALAQEPAKTLTVETASGPRRIHCRAIDATLLDDSGEPAATMHAFGYLGENPVLPVTFFWNGGPGLAAVILHTGFAAPRIADLVGGTGMADNPLTLVDRTDLIYVDPIGTGFSRAIAPAADADYWGVREDADAAAQFVAAVVAEHGWGGRPIYLCGESYGGIRVAAMLAPLRQRGIVPDGLILISPALEMRTLRPPPDSEAGAIRRVDLVPTLAALVVAAELRAVADRRADVEAACRFAIGPLLAAVRAGDDVEELQDADLRGTLGSFTAGASRRVLQRCDPYDARLTYRGSRWAGILGGAKEKAIRSILRDTFDVAPTDYLMSARDLGFQWRGEDGKNFAIADTRAPRMLAAASEGGHGPRVFVAGGWYDVVVPFTTARRLAHEGAFGGCEVELRDYPGGHMIYIDPAAHAALVGDLRAWFDRRVR